MNKEEMIKDLQVLQARHNKILGAIEYLIGKIGEIEELEKLAEIKKLAEIEEKKKSKQTKE